MPQYCIMLRNIICRFVDTHYKLVPYFLTIGAFAMEHGTSAITPLAKHEDFIDKVRNYHMHSPF